MYWDHEESNNILGREPTVSTVYAVSSQYYHYYYYYYYYFYLCHCSYKYHSFSLRPRFYSP